MTGIESKLLKAVEGIHCSNCFYFKMAKKMGVGVGDQVRITMSKIEEPDD